MSDTGIFGISPDRYHADGYSKTPSLSASIAQILCTQSPKHAWTAHPRLNPDWQRTDQTKFDVGTAAHALFLEGRDCVEVIDAPDWRTNAAKEARDAARRAGKTPLLAHQLAEVQAMVDAATRQIGQIVVDPPLFNIGEPERTLIWKEDDVVCRALVDWLHDDRWAIDDFKTTSASANPERWTRTLFTIGADVQTAFYLRGLKALTKQDAVMRYVVQETYPPYALSVISLTPAVLAVGEAKVNYAIRKWRDCLANDSWPAYPSEVAYAELPSWEETRWIEKQMRDAA